jgi:serine/threonine protein kinase
MTSDNSFHCDSASLQSLLAGALQDDLSSDALTHIEQCDRCRNELSRLAAAPEDWEAVQSMLSDRVHHKELFENKAYPFATSNQDIESSSFWSETYARSILDEPRHPEMLGRIGRYDIERLIGSGGMGIVFKGFDTELNRPVAIKVLAPSIAYHGGARQRFSREAKAAAAVVHEHVVPIYNVESSGELPYLVMHYAQGDSLQNRIDKKGSLELKEILRISQQIASGLAAAHAQGLVHRDVKPANVLLENGIERALISDFGLAQAADDASVSCSGFLAGTPQYMSPEQARGEKVNHLSDLFSLGSIMYTMCTGRTPFRGESTLEVLQKVQSTEPKSILEINPDVPVWLVTLIERLMMKQSAARYQSATEVAQLLEQCLAHVQQPLDHSLPGSLSIEKKSIHYPTSKQLMVLGILVVLLPVILGGIAWSLQKKDGATLPIFSEWAKTSQGFASTASPSSTKEVSPAFEKKELEPILWQGPSVQPTAIDGIRAKLSQDISVNWEQLPLMEGLEDILKSVGVDVEFHPSIATQVPDFPEQSVSFHAETTATHLLQRLLSRYQLGYILRESHVEITTLENVRNNPILTLYDIATIARNSREAAEIKRILLQTIEPNAWNENGGSCSIGINGPILYVRATESIHQQVVIILSSLNSSTTN